MLFLPEADQERSRQGAVAEVEGALPLLGHPERQLPFPALRRQGAEVDPR